VIVIGRPRKGTPVDTVRAYSRKGAAAAVRHLHAAGRRRIAFVNGPPHTAPGSSRRLGYLDGLRSCGVARTTRCCEVADDFMIEPGAARRALCSTVEPDAIFCANDLLASARSRRCARPGSTSPASCAWSGMDNTRLCRGHLADAHVGRPRLGRAGRIAAELLLERIEGLTAAAQLGVEPRLVVRASSGAVS
jgi:LacI family transcriptional regulator